MQVKNSSHSVRSAPLRTAQDHSATPQATPGAATQPQRTEARPPASTAVQAGTRTVTSARNRAAAAALQASLATAPTAGGYPVTTTDNVNLRSSPLVDKKGDNILATIPANTTVQVTPDAKGVTERQGFLHVSWNDAGATRDGWISSGYTRPGAAAPTAPAQPPANLPPNSLTTTDNVNLRTSPVVDRDGKNVIRTIPANTTVQATPDAKGVTNKDGFVHVSWNDAGVQRQGWVSAQYTKPAAPPATTPAQAPAGAGQPGPNTVYTQDALNLRPGPSLNTTPIKEIPGGTPLEVTTDPATGKTRDGEFLHVSWQDNGTKRDGWVYGPYTTTTPPSSSGTTPAAPVTTPSAPGQTLEAAQRNFINQFAAERELKDVATGQAGDGTNQNCGPSSLAMALRAQGLALPPIPGLQAHPDNGPNGTAVQAARWWSEGDAKDGTVTNNGVTTYAPLNGPKGATENSQATMLSELQSGVQNAQGKTELLGDVNGNISANDIAVALAQGKSVVASGSFYEDGKVKKDCWPPSRGSQDHVVAITGTTPDGKFIVSDPAYDKPMTVTADQLNAFLRGDNGAAITVYR